MVKVFLVWRWHLAALAIYALLSVVLVDHGASITHRLSGQGSDPLAFTWFLAWWPWAIAHHVDPFFTRLIWQPVGVSLLWVTSVPLLAMLGAPLTLIAGPVVTYNVYVILAPVLCAWFAYLVCFRLTGDGAAALIGGFLFGFSTYEMAQDVGALNLTFSCCVPALLLVVLARLDDEIGRSRMAIWGSVLLVAQFLICIEVFALIFVFGGVAWALALHYLPERRPVLLRLVGDGLIAAPMIIVILLPLLVSMARHYALVRLPEFWPFYFSADIVNLFIPGETNAFGFLFRGIGAHFGLVPQEQNAYLGIPALLILWLFVREHGADPQKRFLVAAFLVLLLCSFGPRLWVAGYYSPIVLPWMILMHLPLLGSALPGRFAMFVTLVEAIIVSLWLSARVGSGLLEPVGRQWRLALAAIACICILPAEHPWQSVPYSRFFEPGRVEAVLGTQPRILILPFAIHGPSSFWQQENEFGFEQTAGYLGFPPAPMQQYKAIGDLVGNDTSPAVAADLAAFCTQTHTQFIVAGPGVSRKLLAMLNTLPWARRHVDDVTVYTVPGKTDG